MYKIDGNFKVYIDDETAYRVSVDSYDCLIIQGTNEHGETVEKLTIDPEAFPLLVKAANMAIELHKESKDK